MRTTTRRALPVAALLGTALVAGSVAVVPAVAGPVDEITLREVRTSSPGRWAPQGTTIRVPGLLNGGFTYTINGEDAPFVTAAERVRIAAPGDPGTATSTTPGLSELRVPEGVWSVDDVTQCLSFNPADDFLGDVPPLNYYVESIPVTQGQATRRGYTTARFQYTVPDNTTTDHGDRDPYEPGQCGGEGTPGSPVIDTVPHEITVLPGAEATVDLREGMTVAGRPLADVTHELLLVDPNTRSYSRDFTWNGFHVVLGTDGLVHATRTGEPVSGGQQQLMYLDFATFPDIEGLGVGFFTLRAGENPVVVPSPTVTTPTGTPTVTSSPTATVTPSPTSTSSPTATSTGTPTVTSSPTVTGSPTTGPTGESSTSPSASIGSTVSASTRPSSSATASQTAAPSSSASTAVPPVADPGKPQPPAPEPAKPEAPGDSVLIRSGLQSPAGGPGITAWVLAASAVATLFIVGRVLVLRERAAEKSQQ